MIGELGRNLFGSLLTEVLVILLAILVKDDKRKVVVVLGVGTVLAGIVGFGSLLLQSLGVDVPFLTSNTSAKTLDCSLTTELDPWTNLTEIVINPDRDGWVQADFWTPGGQLVAGYDEVSVIFEPSLRVTVTGVAGIAWKYDRTWTREDVEWCTNKHVEDSWNIRHKRLIVLTPTELCSIVNCR